MKNLFYFFLLLLSILLSKQTLVACSCIEYYTPECVRVVRSDAVFFGKIEKLYYVSDDESSPKIFRQTDSVKHSVGGSFVARFYIIEKYKGEIGSTIDVYSYIGTSCTSDYSNMKVGDKWTIYANFDEKSKQWFASVGMCGYSFKGNKTPFLQNYKNGKSKETVEGRILRGIQTGDGIPNVSVKIEGKNFSNTNTTLKSENWFDSKSGLFKFEVPQPGKYKIIFTLPNSVSVFNPYEDQDIKNYPTEQETLVEYFVDVPKGLCHFTQLESLPKDLKANAKISGKFVSNENSKIPNFYPELCKLGEDEEKTLTYSNCRTLYGLSFDGKFEFSGLREGKYLLVTGSKNFPELHSPFLRHYFPGVKNFANAQIINLEQGQNLELTDFKLPASIPLKQVSGRLFWKKGVPVTKTNLFGKGVTFSFYDAQNQKYSLSMSKHILPNETENGITLDENGNFTFSVFEGMKYIVWFEADNKKDKEFSKKIEITIDENLKPLEIILEKSK